MMIVVLILEYILQNVLAAERQIPYQGGIRENVCSPMAYPYPLL